MDFCTLTGMPVSLRRVLLTLGCLVCALPLCAGQPLPPPVHVTLSPQHWTEIPLPARAISLTHHGDEIWACGEHELIAVSRDGGSTWQVRHLAKSAEMLLAMTFADDQTGYAWGTDRLMLRSTDGGMTWKRYGHSPGMILDAEFSDPRNGLAGSSNWFAITHDGGKNWRNQAIPDLQSAPYHRDDIQSILALDARRAAVLFAAPDDKHGQLLSSTDDGGGNWKTLRFPSQLRLQTLIRADDAYGAYGCRNDGNGACRPVRLISSDGQDWRAFRQAPPKLDVCSRQGCLEGSNRALLWDHDTAMQFPVRPSTVFDWAASGHGICVVNFALSCAPATPLSAAETAMPPKEFPPLKLDQRPTCRTCPNPDHPSRDGYVAERVVVAGWMDAQGVPQVLTIRSAPTAQMAQAALDALRRWRFWPAQSNHHPIRAAFDVVVNFLPGPPPKPSK